VIGEKFLRQISFRFMLFTFSPLHNEKRSEGSEPSNRRRQLAAVWNDLRNALPKRKHWTEGAL
jgi:hypothetical protein